MDLTTALLGLGSSFFAALAAMLAKRLLAGIPARDLVAPSFFIIGMTLLPGLLVYFRLRVDGPTLVTLGAIILLDAAANVAFFEAIERSAESRVAPVLSLVPLGSALFARCSFLMT